LLEQCIETWQFLEFFFAILNINFFEYSTEYYVLGKKIRHPKKTKTKTLVWSTCKNPKKGKKKDEKKLTACTILPPG
jgi:hypothetical protein